MGKTLEPLSDYPEIIAHMSLDLMTKLTEYQPQEKREAKIEAMRSNAEYIVLKKTSNIGN